MLTVVVGTAAHKGAAREARDGHRICAFDPCVAVDEDAAAARVATFMTARATGAASGTPEVDVVVTGYPRCASEAEAFIAALARRGLTVNRVVLVDADDAEIVRDRALRRSCAQCQARFHLEDAPPRLVDVCDACAGEGLAFLDEDTPAAVQLALPAERAAASAVYSLLTRAGAAGSVLLQPYVDAAERAAREAVLAAQLALASAKGRLAVAGADEKRLAQRYEQETSLSAEWRKKAMLAVKAGNDELAKQALLRELDHQQLAARYARGLEEHRRAVDAMKARVQQASDRLDDLKRRLEAAVVRNNSARAQRTLAELHDVMSSVEADAVLARFQRVAERTERAAQTLWERVRARDAGDDQGGGRARRDDN